jgi:hypothetical protein
MRTLWIALALLAMDCQPDHQQQAENHLRGGTFCEAHANVPACQEQTP